MRSFEDLLEYDKVDKWKWVALGGGDNCGLYERADGAS